MMDYIREAVNLFVSEIQKHKKIAEQSGTQMGVIQDGIVVANGNSYNYNSVADRYLDDGSVVTISVDQSTNQAVILG